jgi:hypothetical protein
MNARPGLNIQIANGCGIKSRLALIDQEFDPDASPAERAAFAKTRFGV